MFAIKHFSFIRENFTWNKFVIAKGFIGNRNGYKQGPRVGLDLVGQFGEPFLEKKNKTKSGLKIVFLTIKPD